ncbi:sensor histidine kinase [Derxia lacustris]|uniref:sensor histidine kinase n=1 Tax=Derxia lacustris TaxID=764842 RepID=UPI000A16CFC1|nr:ATP-binding protein [Derxia lacustris]
MVGRRPGEGNAGDEAPSPALAAARTAGEPLDRLALGGEAAAARLLEVVVARDPLARMLDRLRELLMAAGCARCMLVVFRDGERPERIAGAGDGEGLWGGHRLREVALAFDGVTDALRRWLSHEEILTVRTVAETGQRHAALLSFDVAADADAGALYAFAARALRTLAVYLRAGYERDEALRRELAEAAALRHELESFNHAVSHDLRAPVRRIQGFARLIEEDFAQLLPEHGHAYVQRIESLCDLMLGMCSGLLAVSRGAADALARESVDLGRIARQICADLIDTEPQRQGRLTVRGDVVAWADANMMKALLENLLGNAWKFTRNCPFAEIELGARMQGGGLVYYVRDNGVGFDLAKSDKLFQLFSRLHGENEFPGTGIGLATVSRIVRRHGGRIWADARTGQGATFFFTLGGAEGSPP